MWWFFCGKIVKPVRKKHKISNKTQLGCQMSVNHGKAWLMIRTLKSFASLKMISRKLQNQFKMWRLQHAQIFLSAAWHFDDGQVWYGAGRWPQPTGPLNYADLSQPVTLPENWSQWKGTYQLTHLQNCPGPNWCKPLFKIENSNEKFVNMLGDGTFSHPRQGKIDFNTVNPSLSTGMDFLIHPMRRMSVLHQNSGGIGKSIPSVLQTSLNPWESLRSREISWASGMDFPIPPSFWWSTDTVCFKAYIWGVTIWTQDMRSTFCHWKHHHHFAQ